MRRAPSTGSLFARSACSAWRLFAGRRFLSCNATQPLTAPALGGRRLTFGSSTRALRISTSRSGKDQDDQSGARRWRRVGNVRHQEGPGRCRRQGTVGTEVSCGAIRLAGRRRLPSQRPRCEMLRRLSSLDKEAPCPPLHSGSRNTEAQVAAREKAKADKEARDLNRAMLATSVFAEGFPVTRGSAAAANPHRRAVSKECPSGLR